MKKILVLSMALCATTGTWAQNAAAPAPTSLPVVGAAASPVTAGDASGDKPLLLSPLWIQMVPTFTIPLGDSASYFTMGGGGSILAEYRLPFFPLAAARAELDYGFNPLAYGSTPILSRESASFTTAALGLSLSYNLIPNLGIKAFADGGATYGFINPNPNGYWNAFAKAGLEVYLSLPPGFMISLGGSFLYQAMLYSGLGLTLGVSVGLGTPVTVQTFKPAPASVPARATPLIQSTQKPGTGLELTKASVSDIYPVFYKFYDDHPIGTAVLHNWEKSAVKNVKVSVFVKEYMTDPKETKGPDQIDPGQEATVDLYGLFSKDVLTNTESTKVSAAISVSYDLNGQTVKSDSVQTIQVLRRNSLTWDDDRKAAAFVSANDPTAVKFAKNVQSMVQAKRNIAIDPNLQLAAAVHDALTLYGLTYSNDPVATLNSDNKTVDYIQFPQQTLDYRGGKCSDFSVLYSSMLEAVGVETAFITIPGHIYMAVALHMGQDEARRTFLHRDDLIFPTDSDKVWLPIEITLREGGFVKAWQLGAKEWRENSAKKQAVLYPVHDAWTVYQPVGFASAESNIQIPLQDGVVKSYTDDLTAFIGGEIGGQEATLLAAAAKATDKSKALNSLAVLYSRYGQFDKALKQLQTIVAKQEYVPALVNMGNIYFMQSNNDKALEFYNRAYKKEPNNPTVLLCVARVNQALENYSIAKSAYAQLQTVDPALAQKFAYLDLRGEEATRAADASGLKETVVWSE